jgi:hypothetical protein
LFCIIETVPTFKVPQVIQIPEDVKKRALDFARAVTSTVNYVDSNQSIRKKIEDDHFVSKLGEEAVRILFESRECKVEGPDYSI